MYIRLANLVLLAAMTGAAYALPADRDQPVSVSADRASFNEKTGTALYSGNIVIQQGTIRITADELVVTTDARGTVVTAVSRGNPATIQQKPRPEYGPAGAEAQEVIYKAGEGVVMFNGKARLKQEGASFQGASISYNLERGEIEAKGDKQNRVQLVFPPPPRESRTSKKLGETAP